MAIVSDTISGVVDKPIDNEVSKTINKEEMYVRLESIRDLLRFTHEVASAASPLPNTQGFVKDNIQQVMNWLEQDARDMRALNSGIN